MNRGYRGTRIARIDHLWDIDLYVLPLAFLPQCGLAEHPLPVAGPVGPQAPPEAPRLFASEIAPSANARRHNCSKRPTLLPSVSRGSLYGGLPHPISSKVSNNLSAWAWPMIPRFLHRWVIAWTLIPNASFQREKFPPVYVGAMLSDLRPEHLLRHQKRASEAVGCLLMVNARKTSPVPYGLSHARL